VWCAPIGDNGGALIRTSTSAGPNGMSFERIEHKGLVVWIETDFPSDEIRVGWTPFTGLDVTWPGTMGVNAPPSH
jgi:hypothetical protein